MQTPHTPERRQADVIGGETQFPSADRAGALLGYIMNCVCSAIRNECDDCNVPVPRSPEKKPRIRKDDTAQTLKLLLEKACIVLGKEQREKEKAEGSRRDPQFISNAWYEANYECEQHIDEIFEALKDSFRERIAATIRGILAKF